MKVKFITHEETDDDLVRTMEVSFADNPHGGAYRMGMDKNSELMTQYAANTNAVSLSSHSDNGELHDAA